MSRMRISGMLATVFVFVFPSTVWAQPPEPMVLDEIVAKVNSEIITLTDLDRQVRNLRSAVEEQAGDAQAVQQEFETRRRELLKSMIQNKIMIQRAEELGVTSSIEADVSAYLEEMRKQSGIPSLDVLDQYLRQRGSSLAEYRQNVREKMIVDSMLGQFVYSKITLLTPEVEAYYQENIGRFTRPASVELAEVLFLIEGKNKEAVRSRAGAALQKLKSGTPFEEIAKEYSEGPTASAGGAIGAFQKGSMNAALDEAAFGLKEGQISEIIETEYGFQIIKVLKNSPPDVAPLDEVRPQISEALYQRKAQPEIREFLKELIDQSYIFVNPKYEADYDTEGLN